MKIKNDLSITTLTVKKRFLLNWRLYTLILPAILVLFLFNYLPMYGVVIAFKKYNSFLGFQNSPWIGLDNFRRLFGLYNLLSLIWNTIYLNILWITIMTPLPIILALMIFEVRNTWLKKTIQTISYAPYFISLAVVIGMCYTFTARETGIINAVVKLFGGMEKGWMFEESFFRPIYVLSGIWQTIGWSAIIYVGTLSNVDTDLYEAAKIDGAGIMKRIWHINLPSIMPIATIIFILSIGGLLNVGHEKVLLMQNAGNLTLSEVLSTYVYNVSFTGIRNFGFGAAVGIFNSIVNVFLLLIANYIAKKMGKMTLW